MSQCRQQVHTGRVDDVCCGVVGVVCCIAVSAVQRRALYVYELTSVWIVQLHPMACLCMVYGGV